MLEIRDRYPTIISEWHSSTAVRISIQSIRTSKSWLIGDMEVDLMLVGWLRRHGQVDEVGAAFIVSLLLAYKLHSVQQSTKPR